MTNPTIISFLKGGSTRQAVIDYAEKALHDQGKTSVTERQCQYFNADGSKCAIGHLLPEELYRSSYESLRVDDLIYHLLKGNKEIDLGEGEFDDVQFLLDMQNAHDSISSIFNNFNETLHDNFRKVRLKYDLKLDNPV